MGFRNTGGSPFKMTMGAKSSPLHDTGHTKFRDGHSHSSRPLEETTNETVRDSIGPGGNVLGTIRDIIRNKPTEESTTTRTEIEKVDPVVTKKKDDGVSFSDDCKGIVMNKGNTSKSGKFKCDTKPDTPPPPTPPNPEPSKNIENTDETTTKIVDNKTKESSYVPNPVEPYVSSSSRNQSGTSKVRGGKLKIKIPTIDFSGMGGIIKRVGNKVFTKSGKCKGGCATNSSS